MIGLLILSLPMWFMLGRFIWNDYKKRKDPSNPFYSDPPDAVMRIIRAALEDEA